MQHPTTVVFVQKARRAKHSLDARPSVEVDHRTPHDQPYFAGPMTATTALKFNTAHTERARPELSVVHKIRMTTAGCAFKNNGSINGLNTLTVKVRSGWS